MARAWLLAGMAVLVLAQPVSALCTFYTDPKFPTMRPEVLDTRIRIELLDGYAVVEIAKTFYNPEPGMQQVGDIIFPLPSESAFITALSLALNGTWHNASVVDREEGRKNFSEAVNEQRDASLLEHLGGSQYALRVTLPPREQRTLLVRYEEPLVRVNGEFTYRYPLTEEALSDPRNLSLELQAKTAGRFETLELLGPEGARLERPSANSALVTFQARGKDQLRDDLALRWTTDASEEAQLLVHRAQAAKHFVFHLVPGNATLERARALPFDALVLVDMSGSMAKPGRQGAAVEAVRQVLAALGPEDRFNVAAFRSQPELWAGQLVGATEPRKQAALAFLNGQVPDGSTNLQEALDVAFAELARGRAQAQPLVVVVSDGDATSGLGGQALLHGLGEQNRAARRDAIVHAVQIGSAESKAQRFDPWGRAIEGAEPLLSVLARNNYGIEVSAARPRDLREVLELPGQVLLRNVSVSVEGPPASEVAPLRVPLLLAGGEVLVAGRFEGEGALAVVLRGEGSDGPLELRWEFDTREAPGHPLAERVGAMLRLRALLEDIRVLGPSGERIQQVKALAGKYGYVTPYTSLLVDVRASEAQNAELSQQASSRAVTGAPAPMAPAMGLGGMADEAFDWAPRMEDHPLVKDREVDRYMLAGSAEHQALLQKPHRWLAGYGEHAGIVESDGQVVLFADQATLDTIAWMQGRYNLLPGFEAPLLLAALLGSALVVARRRRA